MHTFPAAPHTSSLVSGKEPITEADVRDRCPPGSVPDTKNTRSSSIHVRVEHDGGQMTDSEQVNCSTDKPRARVGVGCASLACVRTDIPSGQPTEPRVPS